MAVFEAIMEVSAFSEPTHEEDSLVKDNNIKPSSLAARK
jgi:hypothetical protein